MVTWGATSWLLREASQSKDPPAARVEAIKTGLSIGAGSGGAFALLLAVRRQWHQEVAGTANELDAAEKRVTELYTKAADQLGSDKAPVRLAGLYALERVANNDSNQRQTITNLLCAYLRMPFDPPTFPPDDDASPSTIDDHRNRTQELEVRLAAQRILEEHLSWPERYERRLLPQVDPPTFWGYRNIDLTGAVLIDFSLQRCRIDNASFAKAKFHGTANFNDTSIFHHANFSHAAFSGPADFSFAKFSTPKSGTANFYDARFAAEALFLGARFAHVANFSAASFADKCEFGGATFLSEVTTFESATAANGLPRALLKSTPPRFREADRLASTSDD
ncbi:pentapeptide repeat-containing protein [Actinosynnema sp. ALI-1.44]|uniref:pentapeptide repeat-containing protein n=1 Tax=Actinosynnema sp. ALI-1.44 TaxID=1933779 RepID=UPI0011773466|nr:pentapeptide repeat-containing protein [Actinosynnema sp. ALI-1.44]